MPELPAKPVFEYGNERFNTISEEIWDARDRLHKKTIELMPPVDDKSSKKSKKKKKAAKNLELSAGRKSVNESVIDMSAVTSQVGVTSIGADQTLNRTLAPTSTKAAKVKPRDFVAHPKVLKEIGAENYDQFGDLSHLNVDME